MRQSAIITLPTVYSVRDHISYILEATSKRLDFSLIGRKPNEILQLK